MNIQVKTGSTIEFERQIFDNIPEHGIGCNGWVPVATFTRDAEGKELANLFIKAMRAAGHHVDAGD